MKWIQRKPLLPYSEKDSTLEKLAKIRGIEDIDEFFNPTEKSLNDPYLIKNLDVIANRIIKAVYEKELIAISVDPDCDGICSGAILYNYLKHLTDNLYLIYSQRNTGHGVENQLRMIKEGTSLVVILDSSTNSVKACKSLKERGIDVVIVDHHAFEEENPYAIIANPQMDDSPNKHLSGAGLTWKLITIIDDYSLTDQVQADDFIDLACVGMVGDVMRMDVLENRYIVKNGLENIKNKGLRAILQLTNKYNKPLNTTSISFGVVPLLNGATRMDKIELAIELLTSEDEVRCLEIAKGLEKLKKERKETENKLMEAYEKSIDLNDKILFAIDSQASKNFNGLIAQKLAQKYKRPAIVLKRDQERLSGSFRSYGGFKLKDFLRTVGVFGMGHQEAGGVEILYSRLDKIKKAINEKLDPSVFESEIEYDLAFESVDDITYEDVEDIMKFDYITGNGFPKSKFVVKNVFVLERKVIGSNKDTVKFSCDGIEMIKFLVDEKWAENVDAFDEVNAIGNLEINRWFNYRTGEEIKNVQLQLEEISS